MVFQAFNLFSHMTILENVMCGPARILREPKERVREKAMALLERVRITDQANKYPAQLSGGQQQRAAIARTLAMSPRVVLFDEPTSALDPEMIREVVDVMADLARDGMTMIVVTHEIGFAKQCAQRCVFMADGRIVEEASPAVFFNNPQSQRARDFIQTILH
jgi:glutamate transport system ATP-binding protein